MVYKCKQIIYFLFIFFVYIFCLYFLFMATNWVKLSKSSGSMNDSVTVTVNEYTGRSDRGSTITAKTAGGATDTTSVTQKGKAEFISVGTLTYNAAAKGNNSDGSDTIQITGTANTANIKVAETTGKIIDGATYKIQVNAVDDTSWNGKTDTGIDDDPGKNAQYTFTIDVTIPENKSESAKTLEIKLQNGNSNVATEAITINQAAGVKTYSVEIVPTIGTYRVIPAAGGTVDAPSVSYSQTWGWNGRDSGGGTITSGAKVEFNNSKFSDDTTFSLDSATGKVTAPSRGTTEGDALSEEVTIIITLNGAKFETSEDVTQQANVMTFTITDVTLSAPADIPASGGTVSSTTVTAKGSKTYTSGSKEENITLTNGHDDCDITWSSAITAASLGTTVTNRTKKGTLTATVVWKGMVVEEGSVDVYQAANTATYSDITFDSAVSTTVSLKADGTQSRNMTDNSNVGAKQTVTYTSGATRTESSSTSKVVFSFTPTVKTAATGFALSSDGIVSVGANPTTTSRGGFVVTVTVEGEGGKTATREFTFNQQGSSSYITITPDSLTFAAAGEEKTITIDSNDSWTLE